MDVTPNEAKAAAKAVGMKRWPVYAIRYVPMLADGRPDLAGVNWPTKADGSWVNMLDSGEPNMKQSPEGSAAAEAYRAARAARRREAEQMVDSGALNSHMVCPHCQTKGSVRTKSIQAKKGISGGKATAALLTAGISVLGTGLSRKESMTQATCTTCNMTWAF